jgi:hypothetical protein
MVKDEARDVNRSAELLFKTVLPAFGKLLFILARHASYAIPPS